MKKTRFVMMVKLLKRRQRRGKEKDCAISFEKDKNKAETDMREKNDKSKKDKRKKEKKKKEKMMMEKNKKRAMKKKNHKKENKKETNKRGGCDGHGGRLSGCPQHIPNLFQSKVEEGTGPT